MAMRSVIVTGICLAILSLFTPGSSSGAPFLVCDPYPVKTNQPTHFVVIAGESWYIVRADKLPNGGVRLKFDISQLPDGEHALEVRAMNDHSHRVSPPTPFKLVKNGAKVTVPTAEPPGPPASTEEPPGPPAPKGEPPAPPAFRGKPGPPRIQQKTLIPPSYVPKGMIKPPKQ
jgi:hypothetical protein